MQWEHTEWTGSWWARRNRVFWREAKCDSGVERAENCAGGNERKGHSNGMDHISHMAKVKKGQRICL